MLHVQHDSISSFNQLNHSFMTLSSLLPSSLRFVQNSLIGSAAHASSDNPHGSPSDTLWFSHSFCANLVPRVFHFPTPKGAREERPWFRLVTRLGDKFIFMGGVPICQSIVAAAVCYLLNRLSGQPWKALFRFCREDLSYQVHCFKTLKLNCVLKLWKDKNVKL